MVVVSFLSHEEFEPSDHREDALTLPGDRFDAQNFGQKFGQYYILKILLLIFRIWDVENPCDPYIWSCPGQYQ